MRSKTCWVFSTDMEKKKRFYKEVAVAPCESGFTVELDGRAVKTPARLLLVVGNPELAEAVAGEWRAQGDEIHQDTMPFTRYVCTALDRVTPQRDAVIEETVRYGETDQLCYRAQEPDELVKRQLLTWQPLLDWAETHYGAQFETTDGLAAVAQDDDALAKLCAAVEAENDLTLTGLHIATATSGSLIVALALMEGEVDAESAWRISQIEERWQLERWGEDEELVERLEGLRQEISNAQKFMFMARA